MNPNDIFAQQQAMLWQMMVHVYWPIFVAQVACLAVTGWVIYMFYSRLRDIAVEVKKLRAAYENSNPNSVPAKASANQAVTPQQPLVNPDARYLPKKWEL